MKIIRSVVPFIPKYAMELKNLPDGVKQTWLDVLGTASGDLLQ